MATYNIIGCVRPSLADTGIQDLTVNLFKPGGGAALSSTTTKTSGFFQFILDDAFFDANFSDAENIVLSFEVRDSEGTILLDKDDSLIWTQGLADEVILYIDNASLPSATLYNVSGTVVYANGVPAEGLQVKVYKLLFRDKTLLGTAILNDIGNYFVLYNVDLLDATDLGRTSIIVEVYDSLDATLIATSQVTEFADALTINFSLEIDGDTPDLFGNLYDRLTIGLSGGSISDITQAEIQYLVISSGASLGEVTRFVKAYKLSDIIDATTDDDRKYMYAILDRYSLNDNTFIEVNVTDVEGIVNDAIIARRIDIDTPNVTSFINKIKDAQVEALKTMPVNNESYSWNEVLLSIFDSDVNVKTFLHNYNDARADNDAAEIFWSSVDNNTKKGFQLISLSGAQPQMISAMLEEVDGEGGIHSLAEKDLAYWSTLVDEVCTAAGILCIPAIIKSQYDLEDPEQVDAVKEDYAKVLKASIQETYPLVTVKAHLDGVNGADIISDSDARNQVITFLGNNPNFDLRVTKADDIDPDDQDLTGISDLDSLKEELRPFQRLLNVTGGKPDAVVLFKADGLLSANDISSMNQEAFVTTYTDTIGDASITNEVFQVAQNISLITAHVAMSAISTLQDQDLPFIPRANTPAIYNSAMISSPDLATLFGNMNYCACQQCISLYSPAAYLTDLLSFLKNKAQGNPPANTIFQELNRRRPDILYTDLTCKNTNTELPYIDLVNEILENYIIDRNGIIEYPTAYQTQGSSAELKAHPQHVYWEMVGSERVYKDSTAHDVYVYDDALKNAKYPEVLPFSMALEETRTYLANLGTSRYELMKLFKSINGTNNIDDFFIAAEYFGITPNAAKIITIQSPYNTDIWKFYGVKVETPTSPGNGIVDPTDTITPLTASTWTALLCNRLDVLIQQAQISYADLLQLLSTDFLNKENNITIALNDDATSHHPPIQEDTCDLRYLKLAFASTATATKLLEKLYRFVRLWKVSRMSIYELDMLLSRLLGIVDLDLDAFELLGRVLILSEKLNIKPEYLAMFWTGADTHRYINFQSEELNEIPSVYDSIFANKAVINVPIDQFKNPDDLPDAYTGQTALIAAFSRIKEEELVNILEFLNVDMTHAVSLAILSRVYFFGAFSKAIGMPINKLLELVKISGSVTGSNIAAYNGLTSGGTPVVKYRELRYLESIIETIELVSTSGFNFDEIQYVVQDKGAKDKFGINNNNIQSFYEGLRKETQKYSLNDETSYSVDTIDLLRNTVIQYAAKHFNIPAVIIKQILENIELDKVISGTVNIVDALIDPVFVAANFSVGPPPLPPMLPILYPSLALDNLLFLENDREENGNTTLPDFYLTDIYYKYYLIYKIIYIVNRLQLSDDVFKYLFSHGGTVDFDFLTLPFNGEIAENTETLLSGILRLPQWLNAQKKLNLSDDDFLTLLKVSVASPGGGVTINDLKQQWLDIIGKNEKIASVLTDLVGSNATVASSGSLEEGLLQMTFNVDILPSSLDGARILSKVIAIANWCNYIELSPQHIYSVLSPGLLIADAQHVVLAAKSKYDNETWLNVAKPLRDELRKKQREALVQYAIANPDPTNTDSKKIWRNENELYAYFLIDVEMDTCMMTTRIRQALNAIQLLVDRVLLGIEYKNYDAGQKLMLTGSGLSQWEQWRKWYRVWEANRKVFLYPENWIEPDLRTGKSEFFAELEADLKKDDFSDDLAEDAYRSYLNKLGEVARLEPVAAFREYLDGDDVSYYIGRSYNLHTVARTYSEPHVYYYRVLSEGEWSPWEKIDLDIQSNHLMLYIYNGRLCLYWLTFQKKIGYCSLNAKYRDSNGAEFPYDPVKEFDKNAVSELFYNSVDTIENPSEKERDQYVSQDIIEVTMNWSEYKHGKWLKQHAGKDKMQLKLHPYLSSRFNSSINHKSRELIGKKGEVPIWEIMASQLHMSGSIYKPLNRLNIALTFPHHFEGDGNWYNRHAFNKMLYLHGFEFTDSYSDPRVLRENNLKSNFVTPNFTTAQNNKFTKILRFTEDTSKNLGYSGVSFYHSENNYSYNNNLTWRYQTWQIRPILPMVILFNSPNGAYKITSISNFINDVYFVPPPRGKSQNLPPYENFGTNNALGWNFFYEDNKNTFFVTNIPFDNGTQYIPSYTFTTFFHPYVKDFVQKLNTGGIPSFLNLATQYLYSEYFHWDYDPGSYYGGVTGPEPVNEVDFKYDGAYSCYNWELFFHVPLLIAQRLSDNQKFAEARKWYHYIFDPTSTVDVNGNQTDSVQRFWRFKPFYEEVNIETLSDLLQRISNWESDARFQVKKWENNPFDPHAIGRIRKGAYMKNVVMKYLDNLIAWGDNLFKQDTVESINEATQLYILAANILGKKPDEIPSRVQLPTRTFAELQGTIDDFSNAKVTIEKFIGPNVPKNPMNPLSMTALYFCLSANDKLLAYWDTVADRLYKIRNCMSITGATRSLSLFGSPIDPALLVKAAAAGVDTASVLNNLSTAPSNYRFSYILQKANELCIDLKSLGGALLSALEKKDAEGLALLRSTHEISMLEKVKQVKEIQIQEADANRIALVKSKDTIQARFDYYNSRQYMNASEIEAMTLSREAMRVQAIAGNISALASAAAAYPTINLQFYAATGTSFGGQSISSVLQATSTKIGLIATIANAKAGMASTLGGYMRRRDDWQFQAQTAAKELEQVDKQVIALEIRKSIAEKELENHNVQIENARAVDVYMRSKFTNEELYGWMITQIAATYFQSYQLAYAMAKTAERCFDFELPFAKKAKAGYIQFGYWDSLKQGLLAGEKLQYDLRKLEGAYIDGNTREMELTKHVSLVMLDPEELITLRDTGSCSLTIPDWQYDLDYPGHYYRRIKSVSITIPCVAGPYTNIACELALSEHTIRDKNGDVFTKPGETPTKEIATSSAQNDNGLFELNFKDERYIPFEGSGAESTWSISLMNEKALRQFDFSTISDVVLHIKYTAQSEGAFGVTGKAGAAKTTLLEILSGTFDTSTDSGLQPLLLPRYFSLKHEFSRELYAGFTQFTNITYSGSTVANIARPLNLSIRHDHFPYFCKGKNVTIFKVYFFLKTSTTISPFKVDIGEIDETHLYTSLTLSSSTYTATYDTTASGTNYDNGVIIPPNGAKELSLKLYKIAAGSPAVINESDIDDIFMVFEYCAKTP